jgi:G3E family GTPase
MLALPEFARTAVIINEYGEAGIDHDLLRFTPEKILLLENGCVCCALRGDLQQTLRDLFLARREGKIGDFDRIVLETTGLADPAPVLQTLLSDSMLLAQFRLNGVVTCVDAFHALEQFRTYAEARKQVAVADRLIVSKPDQTSAAALAAVKRALLEMAPYATVGVVEHGAVDATFITDIGLTDAQGDAARIERWLGSAQAGDTITHGHDRAISTFVLRFEQPFSAGAFEQCVDVLTRLRGADLLRVKGLINIAGEPAPLVVQGVQHLFHPPIPLERWPDSDRASRLVFITRGISRETVISLFDAVVAVAGAAGAQ